MANGAVTGVVSAMFLIAMTGVTLTVRNKYIENHSVKNNTKWLEYENEHNDIMYDSEIEEEMRKYEKTHPKNLNLDLKKEIFDPNNIVILSDYVSKNTKTNLDVDISEPNVRDIDNSNSNEERPVFNITESNPSLIDHEKRDKVKEVRY